MIEKTKTAQTPQERALELRDEIITLGWHAKTHEELIKLLEEFRSEVDKYILETPLEKFIKARGITTNPDQTKPLQGYCGFFLTTRVQENLALLTLDNQRQILGLENIVERKFEYVENEVTVRGIPV